MVISRPGKVMVVCVSGGEGVPQLWDHGAEAEDPLPAGPAAAPQQAEGVPGEGDPAAQQGECLGSLLSPTETRPPANARCVCLQALEEALNLHTPSASQQPPGQSTFADAANNLKKQELLTQIAVLKEQVRHTHTHTHTHSLFSWWVPVWEMTDTTWSDIWTNNNKACPLIADLYRYLKALLHSVTGVKHEARGPNPARRIIFCGP